MLSPHVVLPESLVWKLHESLSMVSATCGSLPTALHARNLQIYTHAPPTQQFPVWKHTQLGQLCWALLCSASPSHHCHWQPLTAISSPLLLVPAVWQFQTPASPHALNSPVHQRSPHQSAVPSLEALCNWVSPSGHCCTRRFPVTTASGILSLPVAFFLLFFCLSPTF